MRNLLPALGVCLFAASALAETNSTISTINILAAEPAWLEKAAEIADQVDNENGLRIIPMLGAGSIQALRDLSQIQSVDAAIISSDSLAYAKTQGLIDAKDKSIKYVASLGSLEVVLVARKEIKNVTALAGKRIATGPAQSAAFATGELLFNAYEIPFSRVPKQGTAGLQALLAGQTDAVLILGGLPALAQLDAKKFHILALAMPPNLQQIYKPATLDGKNISGLIAKNETVETLSVAMILAVHDWARGSSRYSALQRFEREFEKTQSGPEGGLFAEIVPGWTRHSSAQDLLDKKPATSLIIPTGGTP